MSNEQHTTKTILPETIPTVYVDVIIATHNATKTIKETLESVFKQQNPYLSSKFFLDVIICACDDASDDDTVSIMKQCMVDYEAKHENNDMTSLSLGIMVSMRMATNSNGISRGAGYTRNRATELLIERKEAASSTDQRQARTIPPCKQQHRKRPRQQQAGDYICILDSDDVMKPTRIAEQVSYLLALKPSDRQKTLLGCNFERLPANSTWHYAQWANNLTDERLMLEQYREVTLIQPTWMMSRDRFETLGGYVEAPLPCVAAGGCAMDAAVSNPLMDKTSLTIRSVPKRICSSDKGSVRNDVDESSSSCYCAAVSQQLLVTNGDLRSSCKGLIAPYRLVRNDETRQSLRLAEDLRLFHAHLAKGGLLKLLKTAKPLMMYRHRDGMSQSSQTPRRLLLKLRVKALEDRVLRVEPTFRNGFAIWGAGRDGKDFLKALQPDVRKNVKCFADVDEKKIRAKYYVNKELGVKIPVIHFSDLANTAIVTSSDSQSANNRQDISVLPNSSRMQKDWKGHVAKRRRKEPSAQQTFAHLPVIVCVAMYRTDGVLESNVQSIGRSEGVNLWHFI